MVESVSALVPAVASGDASAIDVDRVGIWEMDLGTGHLRLSTSMHHLFDLSPEETPTVEVLVNRIHGDDRAAAVRAVQGTLDSYDAFAIELRLRVPTGVPRRIRACGRVVLDQRGRPERLLGTVHDITRDTAAEEFRHDPVSGLPTGTLLLARLTHAVQRLANEPSSVGVVHLGIDRLRVVNDSLGHAVGDQVVKAVADRLVGILRHGDTLARVRGGGFVVLCEGLASPVEIVSIADQLRAALHEPMFFARGALVISVSAGVAEASATMRPEAILRRAEEAFHGARDAGGTGRATAPTWVGWGPGHLCAPAVAP